MKLVLGAGYVPDLQHRMRAAKPPISQNELAKEMGKSPTYVSRWFTKNEERRVVPEMATAELIEEALARLIARRKRARGE